MKSTIDELRYHSNKFPRKALEKAIENQEETTEILLDELDAMIEHPETTAEDPDYYLHIYAVFLLAQFREKEACSRILKLVSTSMEKTYAMFGDFITEDLDSIIYSTFDGDFEQLKTVIENPEIDIFVRGAILDVYGKLSSDGLLSREEFIEYLRELLTKEVIDPRTDLATIIQGVIVDRKLFEMIDDAQALYDAGRIDENVLGAYDGFIDFMYDYSFNRERVALIDSAIKEIHKWPMFEKTKEEQLEEENKIKELEAKWRRETQKKQKVEKIGRNDPCPCGSGKKYKKCCMRKDNIYKEKHQEPLEVQERWLKDFPVIKEDHKEDEARITDKFDNESIEIDRLVYLALHRRARPMWEEINHSKEETAKVSYLIEAFELFKEKSEKENIHSFEEYDRSYKIHYRSEDWVQQLHEWLSREEFIAKFGDRSQEVEEIFNQIVE